jgi:hypothetical protein
MAETCSPFDGGTLMYEKDWSLLWTGAMGDGVINSFSGLQVYSDEDGRQVKVRVGNAHIRGHEYTNDAIKVIPVAPNTSGSTRWDRIVVRLSSTAKNALAIPLTGTPGTGSPPAITQIAGDTWDIALGRFPVPSGFGNISASSIIGERTFVGTTAWVDLGNVTVAAAPTDTGVVVGSATTQTARWRYRGGNLEINYFVTANVSGTSPDRIYLGLPNAAKTSSSLAAGVDNFPAVAYTSVRDGSDTSISWAYVNLNQLPAFNASYTAPWSSSKSLQVNLSGSYEIAPS